MSANTVWTASDLQSAEAHAQIAIFIAEFLGQVRLNSPQGTCSLSQEAMEGIGRLFVEIGYDLMKFHKHNA